MYKIERVHDKYGYPVYRICSEETDSAAEINDQRGGILTQLSLQGQQLLHLDGEIYKAKTKYIRGGVPILFPCTGKLSEDTYMVDGEKYHLPIHGLARNFPWKLTEKNEERGELVLELNSTEETLKQYPFEFCLRFTYILRKDSLKILQEYKNLSGKAMPFSAGFHPYFKIPEQVSVHIHASQALNTISNETVNCPDKIPDGEAEAGYLVLDNQESVIRADFGEYKLTLSFDEVFPYQLIWYVKAEKFICLEPWTGKPDALNTKENLLWVQPGETLNTWIEIKLEK